MEVEAELPDDSCMQLLTEGLVGRLAFWADDGPRVHPLNYAVLDGHVVVRCRPQGELARSVRVRPGQPAAFEVDGVDHEDQRGWSVLARGPLDLLEDPAVVELLDRLRPPLPWAPRADSVVVRMRWTALSGRRLGAGWDPLGAPRWRRG